VILVLLGGGLAVWAYLVRERLGLGGLGFTVLRTAGFAAIIVLLANATLRRGVGTGPTTVLLDASLSMEAGAVAWRSVIDSATALAGEDGTILRFGETVSAFDSSPPEAGRSRVGEALRVAVGRGGRVVILTDGELDDWASLPAALRAAARVVVLPRASTPGLAITEVAAPPRTLAGDSIPVTLELATWGDLPDSVGTLEIRDAGRVVARRTVTLPPRAGRGRRSLSLPPGTLSVGTHVLSISVTAAGDRDRRDDTRARVVDVATLPTAALIADPLDWEGRFLSRELADIVPGGLQAVGRLGAGRWIDLSTQAAVPAARVAALRRGATVLILRGGDAVTDGARRSWRWIGGAGGLDGDWYVGGDLPVSDLVPRLAGIPWDSLPPVGGVQPVDLPGYAPVLTARLGRRGAQRVVLAARDSAGRRTLVSTGEGFWRWAFRGGADREAYRTLLAAGVEWLLRGTNVRPEAALTVEPTVPRGVPVPVRWVADAIPTDSVRLEFAGADTTLRRRVAFGEDRLAAVSLPPGVYRWRADGVRGAQGVTVVETYSPECVPRASVPAGSAADAGFGTARVGLRELWWVFGIAMLLLLVEWGWRVRRGLP